MAIIQQQNTWANLWGRAGGREPQRSDLWQVDFTLAVNGLNSQIFEGDYDNFPGSARNLKALAQLSRQHCMSVVLPELSNKSEIIPRDSLPFQMPGADDPVNPVRMQFLLDASLTQPNASPVYALLETWRAFTRAGRGAMSGEPAVTLNSNFGTGYAFNVAVYLMMGVTGDPASAQQPSLISALNSNAATGLAGMPPGNLSPAVQNSINQQTLVAVPQALTVSACYVLENCWISAYRLTDFNYENTRATMIDAQFFCEDVFSNPGGVVQPVT